MISDRKQRKKGGGILPAQYGTSETVPGTGPDGQKMNYFIREIRPSEYPVLEDFLFEAVFIPEGTAPPDRSIIKDPGLQVYIEHFGERPDDRCLVAEVNGKIAGAVWTRIMDDYGHLDDETPSFAISLYKEYRGLGIGTELMKQMIFLLKRSGYQKASLSVQKANYAAGMYQDLGFKTVRESDEEFIMAIDLQEMCG